MNVASAIAASSRVLPVMTARNVGDAEDGADTRIPSTDKGESKGEGPLVARYPMIAFSFNADASRLVLLYRDPATGKTVDQIPSETVLKQYEEAQRKEDKRKKLEVIVGGAEEGKTEARGASVASPGLGVASGAGAGPQRADTAAKPSAAPNSVSAPASAPPAAATVPPAGGGAPRVNVVI